MFFFNDTATTEIYTLSLHDALPIFLGDLRLRNLLEPHPRSTSRRIDDRLRNVPGTGRQLCLGHPHGRPVGTPGSVPARRDRKSTRLNSSHANISYAVFCLKKKTSLI